MAKLPCSKLIPPYWPPPPQSPIPRLHHAPPYLSPSSPLWQGCRAWLAGKVVGQGVNICCILYAYVNIKTLALSIRLHRFLNCIPAHQTVTLDQGTHIIRIKCVKICVCHVMIISLHCDRRSSADAFSKRRNPKQKMPQRTGCFQRGLVVL